MISKNKIKFLKCLKQKKYRLKQKKAILEGRRLIDEAINAGSNIETIWFTEKALKNHSNKILIDKIKNHKILFDEISIDDLDDISNTEHSQGIIAEINISIYIESKLNNIKDDKLLILDGLSDPGNLGTIFRICAWYNIKSVILTSDCVDPFNLKCLRSGVGAHFYFNNIINSKREVLLEYLANQDYHVYCADLKGTSLSDIDPPQKWAIIFGSEAHGLNNDFNIFDKITIIKHGEIESLNASVACGIIFDRLINK